MTKEFGLLSVASRGLRVFAQCQASGSQEANTGHLNGTASAVTEEQTEGPLRAQERATFCRSGPQWCHQELWLSPAPCSQPPPASFGGEEAVCCSPVGKPPTASFLPDIVTPQDSAPPPDASGEQLHYLQTLSSSQNPFWGWQAGKHSAPEAQERSRHSPHKAPRPRQSTGSPPRERRPSAVLPAWHTVGTSRQPTQDKLSAMFLAMG